MIVTDAINKMHIDYSDENNKINNVMKYDFVYNEKNVTVVYSDDIGLINTLRIIVRVNNVDYLFTEYITYKDGEYTIETYVDNEIYETLKFLFFQLPNRKCPTTPFFQEMCTHILNNNPSLIPEPIRKYYKHHNQAYCPYFETITRKSMSPEMRQRIYKNYDSELAKRIIKFCGNTQTLRFTTDINKARDIVAFLDSH